MRPAFYQVHLASFIFEGIFEPAFVPVRISEERRCPECSTHYEVRDRYCPGCRMAVPEWRFG